MNLTNHFLIAMPNMVDPNFAKTLTYICEHTEKGALGVVVNRLADMSLRDLLLQVGMSADGAGIADEPVFYGGPVQPDRGFVLHQPLGNWQSTLSVGTATGLTTSKDILQSISAGAGPDRLLVTLGYAGWGAGQLENEIALNGWLTVEANLELVFELPPEQRLTAAMGLLGVSYATLSDMAGHA